MKLILICLCACSAFAVRIALGAQSVASIPYNAIYTPLSENDPAIVSNGTVNVRITSTKEGVQPKDIHSYLDTASGRIPLALRPGGTFELPLTDALHKENPFIRSDQPPGTLNMKIMQQDNSASRDWMQTYYQSPSPKKFIFQVKRYSEWGILGDASRRNTLAAFFAPLFASNTDCLADWLALIDTLSIEEQKMFMTALRWSNTADGDRAINARAKGDGPMAHYCKDLRKLTRPDFKIAIPMAPEELDFCWASFFATGDRAYIMPIFRVAVDTKSKEGFEMTREMAIWSIRVLSREQEPIRKIVLEYAQTLPTNEMVSVRALLQTNNGHPK